LIISKSCGVVPIGLALGADVADDHVLFGVAKRTIVSYTLERLQPFQIDALQSVFEDALVLPDAWCFREA